MAFDIISEVGNAGDAGVNEPPVTYFAHTEAQPPGQVGLLKGTSVPGTERETERKARREQQQSGDSDSTQDTPG